MGTVIIDGKAFSNTKKEEIKKRVEKLKKEKNLEVGLAVILVGKNPASEVYVRNKHKAAHKVGIKSFEYKLKEEASQEELLELIDKLNNDKKVNGILVQLPLPKHIDEEKILKSIDVKKDVDGFHPENVGNLITTDKGFVPCTPKGCLALIKDRLKGELEGKKAVIVGRSNIVGKPMAHLLLKENCTVTIVHSKTQNIKEETKQADILVVAVGRANMIKKDWVKQGAIVIDVGINRIPKEPAEIDEKGRPKTRLVGDVCFDDVLEVVGGITPVPGGVGPMTIAMLLENALEACISQNLD